MTTDDVLELYEALEEISKYAEDLMFLLPEEEDDSQELSEEFMATYALFEKELQTIEQHVGKAPEDKTGEAPRDV